MPGLRSQALLCAGLFLLTAGASAAMPEEAPARRPVEAVATPAPTPTPLVSLEDFRRLEQSVSRLSLESAGLAKKAEEAASAVQQGLGKELHQLDEQVQKLQKWQAVQVPEFKTLAQTFDDARKSLDEGLKKVEEVRQSIERKGQMMEGLLDLLSTLKRDVNDNSREIAVLKQELSRLNASVAPQAEEGDWWEAVARWRYLPLTATILSGLAVGVALSR